MKTTKKEVQLIVVLCVVYFFCQISRSDFSATFVDMIPATGFTKEQVGLAVTAGYISYAVGMFINSLVVEKGNPKFMVALAMFGCSITHLGIRLFPVLPVIITLWTINGYLQSMIWPCVMKLFNLNLTKETRVRAMSIVSLAQHAGSLSCYLIVPLGLAIGGWRCVMLMTSSALLALGFAWVFMKFVANATEEEAAIEKPEACKLNFSFFVKTNLITFLFLGVLIGMVRDGITTWAPVYYTESFSVTAVQATLLAALIPASKILAYGVGPTISKKFPDMRKSLTICYCCALACTCGLFVAHQAGAIFLAVVLMAALLCFNGSAGIMYVIVLPVRYSVTGRSVSVGGFVDCAFYVGASLAAYIFAWISKVGGWSSVIIAWGACCLLALLIVRMQKNLLPKEENLPTLKKQLEEQATKGKCCH